MRTGPGLARGGCRVLKWMALFGVVFAAGAGSASAQITVSPGRTVVEGQVMVVEVTVKHRTLNMQTRFQMEVEVGRDAGGDATTIGRVNGLTEAENEDFEFGVSGTRIWDYTLAATTETMTRTNKREFFIYTWSDTDAEDEQIVMTFSFGADHSGNNVGHDGQPLTAPAPVRIRIEDSEEQTFEWEEPSGGAASPKEGTAATRTIRIDPAPGPQGMTWNVAFSVNEAGYTLDAGAANLGASNAQTHTVTITPPDNDGDRDADTIELSAFLGGTNDLLPGLDGPLEITFADVHALPEADKIEAQAYEDREGDAVGVTTTEADSVAEGGEPVHVRVTIDRGTNGYPMGEKLIVRPQPVDPAQRADYRIEPNSIEVPTGNGKRHADFVLYARPDDDVGAETLELNLVTTGEKAANGPGEVVGTFSIDVVDATTPLIAPAAQAAAEAAVMAAMGGGPLNPGDSFTVDTNDLFNWAPAAVDAAFAASVRGAAASARVSGETVTVEAKEAGDAAVTVTATGTARGSSAVSTSQTVANTASVTFDVQVVLADLAITLSGPENVNVVEGGQPARVTATANRAVTKDTTVRLSATGGDAVPGDYSVGNVVIEAGDDMGSTLLTATADDEAERSETLTLRGVFVDDESGEDGQTVNSLTFNLWDAAVPALPVAAQLLLAALLAVGGCRRYLRRR